ncbi:hypothetical protein H6F61_24015 [Cyanobacteria bacterium FACHB-472]|nr:hypothetical protein [Cyanobacteria bacterium FACHB-472]
MHESSYDRRWQRDRAELIAYDLSQSGTTCLAMSDLRRWKCCTCNNYWSSADQ